MDGEVMVARREVSFGSCSAQAIFQRRRTATGDPEEEGVQECGGEAGGMRPAKSRAVIGRTELELLPSSVGKIPRTRTT